VEYWVAVDGDRVVGTAQLALPNRDNLDNGDLELLVHPEYRRRGVGRGLFAHVAERARGAGRKWLIGEVCQPLPGDAGSVGLGAGARFAAAVGGSSANVEVRRRLELDQVDDGVLDGMSEGARERAGGYSLRLWSGSAPDDLVTGIAALDSTFLDEAPMGDLVYEAEQVDAERVRANDRAAQRRGRRMYGAVACHDASGEVVALTGMGLNHCPDDQGFQNITLVAPKHRGHRLGLLVKLANLAQARAHEPALRSLHTWNARQNAHMIAINEAMGYRPVDAWGAWQLAL
jgi:GNAT superfamily N-acetyltransferase